MSKIKSKLSLLKRKTVTREVGGQPFTFHPISIPMLFELKTSLAPLLTALKALFPATATDGTRTKERVTNPEMGTVSEVEHRGATPVELAKFRAAESSKAVKEAIETVLGTENRVLLGRVLADSLREEFGGRASDDDARALVEEMDFTMLVEMVGGLLAANAQVFGPFAERVRKMAEEKLNLRPEAESAASESPNPSPS